MLPLVEIPETIGRCLAPYRSVFCREAGFEHISRYVSGLILSPNKTLQGIYDLQVWVDDKAPSRRAMHEAVFEAGWASEALMPRHREVVSADHRGRGREVISLDWTFAPHDRGAHLWGVSSAWDYTQRRYGRYQTVMTAVVTNRELIDGLEVAVHSPDVREKELAYLKATVQASYEQMEAARTRLLELLHHAQHRQAYQKRTEMAVSIVQELEQEGHFPQAHDAFDNGLLSLALAREIELRGKHGVSEVESSRHIQWLGQWRRVDEVARELRQAHPERFRSLQVRCRHGEMKSIWVFTKVVRLKRDGRKRLVIVHEQAELSDAPRFLRTDARHWESGRVIETWSYRWAIEVFHDFGKQVTGLESAQVRKEEAVKRHFRLSCVAQSVVQRVCVEKSTSERFAFASEQITVGQKVRTIAREALHGLLELVESLLAQGHSCEHILEVLMPA
jgi:hypothetical protein